MFFIQFLFQIDTIVKGPSLPINIVIPIIILEKTFKATNSLFYFEDIRIYRDHKNMVNRLNNCEIANQEKTFKAGVSPVDSPTVPNADTTSNATSDILTPLDARDACTKNVTTIQ